MGSDSAIVRRELDRAERYPEVPSFARLARNGALGEESTRRYGDALRRELRDEER
jgi:hypothetical protein